MTDATKTVSDYWAVDRRFERSPHWLDHRTARAFINRRVSGDPTIANVEWIRRKYFSQAPADLALSLGCGFGSFERALVSLGMARAVHANDISPGAIEKARMAAADAAIADRIVYSVADLNTIELPTSTYDAIFGMSAIHHVEALDHLFDQCRRTLKPNGLLFMDEYIGPSRFQVSLRCRDFINRFLSVLPPRHRVNLFVNDGTTINDFQIGSAAQLEAIDPSEAVRSADLLTALARHFNVTEIRPYGGAIMHLLLHGIAGNFDPTDERDAALITLLATFEEMLEANDLIGSDFAVIVAAPKSLPQTSLNDPRQGRGRGRLASLVHHIANLFTHRGT